MSDIRVASRYAKSLLELAEEKGSLEQVRQDMQLFSKTVLENRDFKMLLKNPVVKPAKKGSILQAIFNGKVTDLTASFFRIVAQKGRENMLETIASEFEAQYKLRKGIQDVHVKAAVPLTDGLREQIIQLVANKTGKSIQLEEKTDPSLIGGFILTIGDTQIDDSIKSSLQRLRNKFNDNSYITKL